jgi:RNA polymerase sigma factor (TIGR02999 family)
MSESAAAVTQLLQDAKGGNRAALDELLPLVYEELRRIASRQLSFERSEHTLQATALVNEAYLVLIGQHSVDWQNRAHFFSIAAEAMRRILVNYAIARRAEKRGAGATLLALDDVVGFANKKDLDLVLLNEALERLAASDVQQAKIVEMRFFGGMSHEEIGNVLGVSESTVRRDWRSAKAWLLSQLA